MVKVVAFKGQYRITIPKELAEEKNWKPGTVLRFVEDADGNVILRVMEAPEGGKGRGRREK